MIISTLTKGNLPGLIPLATQLGYPVTVEELERRFSNLVMRDDHALFIASKGSDVLGWIHLHTDAPSLLGEARVELAALVVLESARGKGIGAALVKRGEEWTRTRGIHLIRVRTNTVRKEAHRFYERAGYKLAKTWHLYLKEV